MIRTAVPIAALAVLVSFTACGSGTAVDIQTYTVSLAVQPQAVLQPDGTLVSTLDLVVDTDGGHVIGATLKYAVSAGELSPAAGVSGADGLARVVWTVTPAEAVGHANFTFSACADNQDPAVCDPQQLATLEVHGTPTADRRQT